MDATFLKRKYEWVAKNDKIITWIRNTSTLIVCTQLGTYDTAKTVWDFLVSHFSITGLSHRYQLYQTFHHLHQASGQILDAFLAKIHPL